MSDDTANNTPTTAPAEVRKNDGNRSIYVQACDDAFDNLVSTMAGGQYTIEELRYLFARTMQIGQSVSAQVEEAERHFSEQKRLADGYDEAVEQAKQEGQLMHVQVAQDEDGNILSVTADEIDEMPTREEQH